MKFNSVIYFISDAFKSLKRNATISIASALTVLTTLVVFGAFLLTALNVSVGVQDVQSKVQLKVFLQENVTQEEQTNIENTIKAVPGVKSVTYESKAQALENFKNQLSNSQEILQGYTESNNPLPASYVVDLTEPTAADAVIKAVKPNGKLMAGVNDVGNDQEVVNAITSFANTVRWVGLILFVVLIGVSLFLIMNTIKITVYSRRREIGIMKFVGATDWFIRWPFIIEGIVIGLVGSIISILVIYGIYSWLYSSFLASIYTMKFISPFYVLTTMSWQFVIAGVIIGAVGSIIALRKFLDV
ncbi:permease-like cell division protein FtsX [Clostridium massiliamazoniense]|uniref:permease-like cell division protein FtsX n=1 Tax=Clostridium massiliamazoniense TaxID=1347366 RepID=UPI0006D8519C|nr:permease-like cell division protein FtsX [Clostridium massiliamazoniense]